MLLCSCFRQSWLVARLGLGGGFGFDVEIKDDEAFEPWLDEFNSFHVLGVGKIGVAGFGAVEGHNETVGVAVAEPFIGLVGTVFHTKKAGDQADHGVHLGEALVDLFVGDVGFKLEYSEVSGHGKIEC